MQQQGSENLGTTAVPLPGIDEFCRKVRSLITPDFADKQAKDLIDLLFAIADPGNEAAWDLAQAASREAFLQTMAFQRSFEEFAFGPAIRSFADERVLQTSKEM